MNINTMRRIDLLFGIPLCFLMTIIYKSMTIFVKKSPSNRIKKVLLIKLSEMGAVTLTYPLLVYLKKEYPQVEISFLVFEKNASALKIVSKPDENHKIFTIKDGSLEDFIRTTFKTIFAIRQEKFDVVIDLEFFSRFTSLLTFLSSANNKVGFYHYHFEGLYRGDLLTHRVQYNPLIHCSRSYLSLAKALKNPTMFSPEIPENINNEELVYPRHTPNEINIQKLKEKLTQMKVPEGKIFLINPGEGLLPLREWPIENFVELSKRILSTENHVLIIIGKESYIDKDQELMKAVNHPRLFNLVNKTTMDELISLFHLAEAMITNDCGLPHLASLTTLKRIVLFGPESPLVFAPVGENVHVLYSNYPCSPCLSALNHRNSSCQNNLCLKHISIDEVFKTLNIK